MKKSRLGSWFFATLLLPTGAAGQTVPSSVGVPPTALPSTLLSVGFDPQLNAQMPLDLTFHDETGRNIRLLLYCYVYDPTTARYSAGILKIMRLGGLLTIKDGQCGSNPSSPNLVVASCLPTIHPE